MCYKKSLKIPKG